MTSHNMPSVSRALSHFVLSQTSVIAHSALSLACYSSHYEHPTLQYIVAGFKRDVNLKHSYVRQREIRLIEIIQTTRLMQTLVADIHAETTVSTAMCRPIAV